MGSWFCEIKAQGKVAHNYILRIMPDIMHMPGLLRGAVLRSRDRFALIGFAILPVELLFAPTGQVVQSRSISSKKLPYCLRCHQVPDRRPTACVLAFVLLEWA